MISLLPLLLLLCVPTMGQTLLLLNATVGGSVLIPCSLPVSPVRLIRMYWQEEESSSTLFHRDKNSTRPITNRYKNRSRAFETEFRFGNMSVILDNATVEEDQKTFWTYVSYYDEHEKKKDCLRCCECKLQVSAPYQDLEVTLNGTANRATCTAHGGYPQPQVSWTGLNKSSAAKLDLQAAEPTLLRDPTNKTFSVTSSVSVEGLKEVTCHIYNPHSHESMDRTEMIPGDSQLGHQYLVILIVGIVLIILLLLVFCVWYKYRRGQEFRVLYRRPPPVQ